MNRLESIEKLALHRTLDKSIHRYLELAYRHYSKTYNTALHVVQEIIPEEEALLIYFEDQIESVQSHELNDMITDIYKIPSLEEINAGGTVRSNMPVVNDDEWIAKMNMKIQKDTEEREKAIAAKKAEVAVKEVDDVISRFNKSMSAIKSSLSEKKK